MSNSSRVTRSSRENVWVIIDRTFRSISAAGLLAMSSEIFLWRSSSQSLREFIMCSMNQKPQCKQKQTRKVCNCPTHGRHQNAATADRTCWDIGRRGPDASGQGCQTYRLGMIQCGRDRRSQRGGLGSDDFFLDVQQLLGMHGKRPEPQP